MQLKIPRLKKHELASRRLTPNVQLALYNGPSKLNPPSLPAVALSLSLSPEETVQSDTAMARARTRDAAWLSHVQTEDKVEWAGCNTYLDRQEASTSTKKQIHWWYLDHLSMRHLPSLIRSWRHSSTWKIP